LLLLRISLPTKHYQVTFMSVPLIMTVTLL
jgi:hypothetical protein